MSTSKDFIAFVLDQLAGLDSVRARAMFGEYCVYVDDRPVFLVCDNTVYVKKLPEIEEQFASDTCGFPYPGASEHFVVEIDDREQSQAIALTAAAAKPMPRKKKTRKQ